MAVMPRLPRIARFTAGLLFLALATAWIGVPLTHHHAAPTACEACKFLQTAQAALPVAAPSPERDADPYRVEVAAPTHGDASPVLLPRGRAPPRA